MHALTFSSRVPLALVVGSFVIAALAACGGPPALSDSDATPSDAALGEVAIEEVEEIEEIEAQAVAADIREVDLGTASWFYSHGGTELPVTVGLVNGAASDGATAYALEDVQYGDVDGDGDEDAISSITQSNGSAFERLWYLWLVDGAEVTQLVYPIAQTSRCGTAVDAVVAGDGSVSVTQRQRIAGIDDAVACSDAGSGLQVRTITVQSEGDLLWPVQTAPIPAWGGICPGSPWPDSEPGLIDWRSARPGSSKTAAGWRWRHRSTSTRSITGVAD